MSFKQAGWRRFWRGVGALAVVLAGVGGCGGGGQVDPFNPDRVLAFGDEYSRMEAGGLKYSINSFKSDGTTLDCTVGPMWVQLVASGFGLVFPECNPDAVADPRSRILATNGAKVADMQAAIDQFLATDAFREDDLVTMMVGVNDVLELYKQYPVRSEADLMVEVKARGTLWGQQINRVALLGAAVLVATIPDVSLSPYAIQENVNFPGTDRQGLLRRMIDAYDDAMRLEIINDGRLIGLVFGDIEVQNGVRFPGSYGYANTTTAACTTALPNCTTSTLGTDANAFTWMWADDIHLTPQYQLRLGNVALNRARNSPF